MIRILKTISSLIILVCLFLPVAQCSIKAKPELASKSAEMLIASEAVKEDMIILNLVFNEDIDVSIESVIWFGLFFMPLILTLLPGFSNWKRTLKLIMQSLFSFWFVYNCYLIVLGFSNPLAAGWLLIIASVSFLLLCLAEWSQ